MDYCYDGFKYELIANDAILKGFDANNIPDLNTRLTIPDKVDGRIVTGIQDHAFYLKGIKDILLPATISFVGKSAFAGSKIERFFMKSDMSLRNGELRICEQAFENCIALKTFCPNKKFSVSFKAFSGCGILDSQHNRFCVSALSADAFHNCWGVTDVMLEDCGTLHKDCFRGSNIHELTIVDNFHFDESVIADLIDYGIEVKSTWGSSAIDLAYLGINVVETIPF